MNQELNLEKMTLTEIKAMKSDLHDNLVIAQENYQVICQAVATKIQMDKAKEKKEVLPANAPEVIQPVAEEDKNE